MLIAIGVEDHRALSELPFEAIRIQFGLALPDARIPAGTLGFHQPKGLAIVAPQHVIDKSLTGFVWHAGYRELGVSPRLIQGPSGLVQ